jgi:acetylornithine aminotransferase
MLGTTFGGNYLACVAAIAVIEIMEQESLMDNARIVGGCLIRNLSALPGVKNVTGKGLMIGVHADEPANGLRKTLLNEHHIFTGSASDPNVIRLLPPLSISANQATACLKAFESVLQPQHVY